MTARAEPTDVGLRWRTDAGTVVARDRIRTISIKRGSRGAAQGAAIGFVVAGLMGVGVMLADEESDAVIAPLAGFLFGALGMLPGAWMGGMGGSFDEYRLTAPGPPPRPATPAQLRLRQRCAKETAKWRRSEGDDRVRLWGEMSLDCQRLVSGLL